MSDRFFVTTAIPYMNSHVHIGNSLEYVLADAIARAARLSGYETNFLTGTDEHGQKIYNTAKEKKLAVANFVQQNVSFFQSVLTDLNISYDDFIRTTDQQRHWPVVEWLWNKIKQSGDLYEKEYEGLYCVGCESFLKESDLKDGKCPLHNKEPELVKERNWFFKLSNYKTEILEFLRTRVEPRWRANEMINFVEQGLGDISFSRPKNKLDWGIPVPGDESQVIYVWCDALTNYLSAVSTIEVSGADSNSGELKSGWWPASVHVVGKDIAKFHTLYWPAMLLSAGLELPQKVLIHGFITVNGQKISKSLGNVIEPAQITESYGSDALRFYYLHEVPTVDDGDFSLDHLKEVYNGVLADGLGNLVQRLLVMANKYEVEWVCPSDINNLADRSILKMCLAEGHFEVQKALNKLVKKIEELNKNIQQAAPWLLYKTDPTQARAELVNFLNDLSVIAITLQPFLPNTSQAIIEQLTKREPTVIFTKLERS